MVVIENYALRTFGVMAILLLLLSACSKTEQANTLQFAPDTFHDDMHRALPRNEVLSVLASGFYQVSERALKPVSVRQLGLEGLRGLATIDPAISIDEYNRDALKVYYGGEFLKTVVEPLEHDSESWADAVYDVLAALWPVSNDLTHTNPERVYEAIFDASLANLDVFSRYAGKREATELRDRREGFGGVGLQIGRIDERIMIKEVEPESPADQSGIEKGDIILTIDDEAVIGRSLVEVDEMLRGKIQSEMTITIERPLSGMRQKLFVWRELMIEQTVWPSYEDGLLSLKITGFNEKTARRVARDIQDKAVAYGKDFRGIVLDLRSNPGGLLKKAVQVADLFIPGGRIISTQGRHPDSIELYEADKLDVAQGRPVIVLLNGASASAAEIVAAAIQDRGRGVVIGSSSYGKGTVQSVQRLPNGGEITVTWSRLIAPSGYAFHGLGVRPTICTSGLKSEPRFGPALRENDGRSLMNKWRKVGFDDFDQRKTLRSTCPPDRTLKRIDQSIAENLIQDPSLYERFVGAQTIATVVP